MSDRREQGGQQGDQGQQGGQGSESHQASGQMRCCARRPRVRRPAHSFSAPLARGMGRRRETVEATHTRRRDLAAGSRRRLAGMHDPK